MLIRVCDDLTGYAPASERFAAFDADTYCGCGECRYPVGTGATAEAALADLLEQIAELEDAG